MSTHEESEIIYPPGVKEITDDLSTDELVNRLSDCTAAFQNFSSESPVEPYIPLALYLGTNAFIYHENKDVQLHVACCIADIFRCSAPDVPYKDIQQLKTVFQFLGRQLKGLADTSHPSYKLYFYLLENFASVQTFNVCVDVDDNQSILAELFKTAFEVITDKHTTMVSVFFADILGHVLNQVDYLSQEVLDLILIQIVKPRTKVAYHLAHQIVTKNADALDPYMTRFFNNALILSKHVQSKLIDHVYDLLYMLNSICPSMLSVIISQLEFKLKCNNIQERMEVTRLLGRMFSDRDSTLAYQYPSLWNCFKGRFTDISPAIRIVCIQYSTQLILYHPELKSEMEGELKLRQHDNDENVRLEVVSAIMNAAKKDVKCVTPELFTCVKERARDKQSRVRREALLSLASIYKHHSEDEERANLDWIKHKLLHTYYQNSLEDKVLVERIVQTCLVPYNIPVKEKMKKLYHLFATLDDYAVKAFKEILKYQNMIRSYMRTVIRAIQTEPAREKVRTVNQCVELIAKYLVETQSSQFLFKFCKELETNCRLRNTVSALLSGAISCEETEKKTKEALKVVGFPVQTNIYYMTIKQLLERIGAVIVDREAIQFLTELAKDALLGDGHYEVELNIHGSGFRGVELLETLSSVFLPCFCNKEVYESLLLFLKLEDEKSTIFTLKIFERSCLDLERRQPEIYKKVIPVLEHLAEAGTVKQAKYSTRCICLMVRNKQIYFGNLIEKLRKNLTLNSKFYRSSVVSIGQIACTCRGVLAKILREIVTKDIFKDLLMVEQRQPRERTELWGDFESLPEEAKVKIEGMKIMVLWVRGLRDRKENVIKTLKILHTVIQHNGDIINSGHNSPMENSWMKFTAAACILKLCQEPTVSVLLDIEQYQALASIMLDESMDLKKLFVQKLHKKLSYLRLSLDFFAIFCLAGLEADEEFKSDVKGYILENVKKRRDYVKCRAGLHARLHHLLPDYVMPYAIHLLAHMPFFRTYNDVTALLQLKECLWMLMEPIIVRDENFSFGFLKRLIENIKQTKDRQNPDDEEGNKKLYAVCDLAVDILMTKAPITLNQFPAEPLLPSKFFTSVDKTYSNRKIYLPPELVDAKTRRLGVEFHNNQPAAFNNNHLENSTAQNSGESSRNSLAHESKNARIRTAKRCLENEGSTNGDNPQSPSNLMIALSSLPSSPSTSSSSTSSLSPAAEIIYLSPPEKTLGSISKVTPEPVLELTHRLDSGAKPAFLTPPAENSDAKAITPSPRRRNRRAFTYPKRATKPRICKDKIASLCEKYKVKCCRVLLNCDEAEKFLKTWRFRRPGDKIISFGTYYIGCEVPSLREPMYERISNKRNNVFNRQKMASVGLGLGAVRFLSATNGNSSPGSRPEEIMGKKRKGESSLNQRNVRPKISHLHAVTSVPSSSKSVASSRKDYEI